MTQDEELNKLAEFIVNNSFSISPEYVGERLADAEAPIDSWLKSEERTAALEKRSSARRWLIDNAQQAGYPVFGTGIDVCDLEAPEQAVHQWGPEPNNVDAGKKYQLSPFGVLLHDIFGAIEKTALNTGYGPMEASVSIDQIFEQIKSFERKDVEQVLTLALNAGFVYEI